MSTLVVLALCVVIYVGVEGFMVKNRIHLKIYGPTMHHLAAVEKIPCLYDEPEVDMWSTEATVSDTIQLLEKVAKKRDPIGSSPVLSIEGDSTEEEPYQRHLLYTHFALVLTNLVSASISGLDPISGIIAAGLSVVVGDFATGVFHWSVDNYGRLETPIVGTVCAAFQGHHDTPWTITFRSFANNVYKICKMSIGLEILVLTASLLMPSPFWTVFFALFANWWVMSQEFHKYSHLKSSQVPPFIKAAQDAGLILSRKEHGRHHTSPFEGHYCILNGMCNPILDNTNFFRHLERIVFQFTGNRPNTWIINPNLHDI